MMTTPERLCWCGNSDMHPFSADYLVCASCGTLISQLLHSAEPLAVRDDQHDFYGKEYWLSHQRQDLGLPDIYARARADLPERCLYWLRTLLMFKQPPARVLELGSSHGGFVALLRWAGFDAIGTELSPWVVDFARQTFDIPMLLGDIEQQQLPEQSFDVVVLNDVLEHLPDPLGTLRYCAALLKPDGIILIQTPSYPHPQAYQELVCGENRFIEMLEPDEHLYLFSQRAVRQLFGQLGYAELHFLPALFEYDMYFVASKQPLAPCDSEEIAKILTASPAGRMTQALLDKANEVEQLRAQGAQVATLEADVAYLKGQISAIEASQQAHIEQLNAQLAASEADRAARLQIIEQQAVMIEQVVAEVRAQLIASEADRAARLAIIEQQGVELGRIPALEADVAYLKAQIASAEADRAARLAVIERQGAELGQWQHALTATSQQIEALRDLLGANKPHTYVGVIPPGRWKRILNILQAPISSVSTNNHAPTPDVQPEQSDGDAYVADISPVQSDSDALDAYVAEISPVQSDSDALDAYVAEINDFNRAQANAELLDSIRAYNHSMIDTFAQLRPFQGKRLLDIGASPHGYALERALALGVAEYVGIGLDVEQPVTVQAATGCGKLLYMNAEQLDLPAQSFDLVISLSTFEHVSDVPRVLSEIKRVLKPGGSALITFEPIWTCSYGHHLHHFGSVAALMPDWAQLLWDKEQMRAELASIWPADGAITLDEAISWTFDSSAINRIPITMMREYFTQSGMEIEWIIPVPDEQRDPERLRVVIAATSFSAEDLMAKGLSVLLNNVEDNHSATGNA